MLLEFTEFEMGEPQSLTISVAYSSGTTFVCDEPVYEQALESKVYAGKVSGVYPANQLLNTGFALISVAGSTWNKIREGRLTGIIRIDGGSLILTHPVSLIRHGQRERERAASIAERSYADTYIAVRQALERNSISDNINQMQWRLQHENSIAKAAVRESTTKKESAKVVIQEYIRKVRLED